MPLKGEHCAWMESSAVVYVNSVLGARTNVEGRESTGAAMLTGKIPYWGLHLEENRRGSHLVEVTTPVVSNRDWGLLGYWIGEQVPEEAIPVVDGIAGTPDLVRLKHFGAAAASSGGVEMYHVPGDHRGGAHPRGGPRPGGRRVEHLRYGPGERREAYEHLNATASDTSVDLVMIGCPHATLGQIRDVVRLLEGRRVHPDSELWVFTPRALRHVAEQNGYARALEDAGALLMSDTCPAIGQFLPKGTRVIATDSAKQVHYLPAIMNVQGWFGTLDRVRRRRGDRHVAGGAAVSESLVLAGRGLVGGVAEGEALVTREAISGLGRGGAAQGPGHRVAARAGRASPSPARSWSSRGPRAPRGGRACSTCPGSWGPRRPRWCSPP